MANTPQVYSAIVVATGTKVRVIKQVSGGGYQDYDSTALTYTADELAGIREISL